MKKKNYKILIVDDNIGLSEGLKRELSTNDFCVETIDNGIDAIARIKKKDIHLAFIDLQLPDMSGIDIVKSIDTEITNVVIITAFATIKTAIDAMKLGAADYIQKPFDYGEIVNIADRFFNKHSLINDDNHYIENKGNIIIASDEMKEIEEIVNKIKDQNISILLLGESGTGKEIMARLIHKIGNRKESPFIGINCNAIPKDLLESELFGCEKGTFSDTAKQKIGKFESAKDGIIFLDEIGDMNYPLQSKILRVLEEKTFERLGGTAQIPFKARIIASTNHNLKDLIKQKKFREDLYYRLNGIKIEIPPLRNRKDDIEPLIFNFINSFKNMYKKTNITISSEAIRFLKCYSWPGNIRELRNVVESAVLLANNGKILFPEDFYVETEENYKDSIVFENEKKAILDALQENKFNKTLTAKSLKISRKSLYDKMKRYSIIYK